MGPLVLIVLSLLGAFPQDRGVVMREESTTYEPPRDAEGATRIAGGKMTMKVILRDGGDFAWLPVIAVGGALVLLSRRLLRPRPAPGP